VQYHILTEEQHAMLIRKYQLTGDDPYRFTIYERDFPLSNLAAVLEPAAPDPGLACAAGRTEHG
jgi:hypothetical protein